MKLSVSVMAHPSRAAMVPTLLGMLPGAQVYWDTNNTIWDTCKGAWKLHDPSADYHVVIQDDAIICQNFEERARKLLESGFSAYSFYFSNSTSLKQMADEALARGGVVRDLLHWGVAVCLKTSLINEMIKYCDKLPDDADDVRIKKFLQHKGIPTFCPMPSLVDHRPDIDSLVDNKPGRKAMYFIDTYHEN